MEEERSALDGAGDVIECTAYTDGYFYSWHFVKVAGDPFFLSGSSIGDKKNIRISFIDEIFYFFFFIRRCGAAVCSDDSNVRELFL